nr:hypothetical protein [Tanacetum cinerariifolium]
NFHGWSRNIKMALGAKMRLGFTDGSCVKPTSDHDDLQRWIRCDYMSNGPLVYQLERELSKISQGNLSIASYFNKLKKCWDELHNINGMPTCDCGKMRECTCSVLEKFSLRDSNFKLIQFLMKLNDEYESIRSQILAMDPLPTVNKAYYIVQQIKKHKQVTNHVFEPIVIFANMNNKNNSNGRRENNKGNMNEIKGETKNEISFRKVCPNYGQEGHLFEQCFERLGYPDWYKGKKAKKNNRLAAHVNLGFDEHLEKLLQMRKEDLTTNQIVAVGKGSKNLYIYKPTLDQATYDAQVSAFCKTYQNVILVLCFNKNAFSNSVSKHSVDIKIFHERLPFQRSTSIVKNPFDLIHVDLWGTFKHPAQDGAHYFYTIVDDHTIATWTYWFILRLKFMIWYDHLRIIGCLCYAAVTVPQKDTFDNRGIKCVLLGYPMNQKGYKLYNLQTQVFNNSDVVFKEDVFPFKDSIKPEASVFILDFPSFGDEFSPENTQTPIIPDPAVVIPNTHIPPKPDNGNFDSSTTPIPQNANSIPLEPTKRSTRQSTRPV